MFMHAGGLISVLCLSLWTALLTTLVYGPLTITVKIHVCLQTDSMAVLANRNWTIVRSPGDGHCFLHSLVTSWNKQCPHLPSIALKEVKQSLNDETVLNADHYAPFLIPPNLAALMKGLHSYLLSRQYNQLFGDLVPIISANAFHTTLCIFNELPNGNVEEIMVLPRIPSDELLVLHRHNDHFNGISFGDTQGIPQRGKATTLKPGDSFQSSRLTYSSEELKDFNHKYPVSAITYQSLGELGLLRPKQDYCVIDEMGIPQTPVLQSQRPDSSGSVECMDLTHGYPIQMHQTHSLESHSSVTVERVEMSNDRYSIDTPIIHEQDISYKDNGVFSPSSASCITSEHLSTSSKDYLYTPPHPKTHNIDVIITHHKRRKLYTHRQVGSQPSNLITAADKKPKWILPNIMLTNARSVMNKLEDLHVTIEQQNADIVCISESFLSDEIPDDVIEYEGFAIHRKNRNRHGGGVLCYIKESLKLKKWTELDTPGIESVWFTVSAKNMPRDIPSITVGAIYHPPSAEDGPMLDHIMNSLDHITQRRPSTHIILLGDFNQLRDVRLRGYPLKQAVKKATRKDAILDKIYTNFGQYYQEPDTRCPVGLSDHNVVVCCPLESNYSKVGVVKQVATHVMDHNSKVLFAQELKSVDWRSLFIAPTVTEQFHMFQSTMDSLMDKYFPLKIVTRCSSDKPWVTDYFRELISKREYAWNQKDTKLYNMYRNKVNRLSKTLASDFYKSEVAGLRVSDSRGWWKHVKNLLGLNSSYSLQSLADELFDGNLQQLADAINNFFLSVCDDLEPLDQYIVPPKPEFIPDEYSVSVEMVERKLMSTMVTKSAGPDKIFNWVLHDLAGLISQPVCAIWNSSIHEGVVPTLWKSADVVPLPKVSTPQSIESDLRPISLTSVIMKHLESFVGDWLWDFVSPHIDPYQYGGVRGTNTTHALTDLVQDLHADAEKGLINRLLFLDYKKAFDHVDHTILVQKIIKYGVPPFLTRWIASFLSRRKQRVKIGGILSEWGDLVGSVPQGSSLGPLLYIIHINDLRPQCKHVKYMDDTTLKESFKKENDSKMQQYLNYTLAWSKDNKCNINAKKTKDMVSSFRKVELDIPPLMIRDQPIERVKHFKTLGVTLQDDLKWNIHTSNLCKKGSHRLFFLKRLKKCSVEPEELLGFFNTCVRPVLEYAAPVWATGIHQYEIDNLESIQKRAIRIILPGVDYSEALKTLCQDTLYARRNTLSYKLFAEMQDPNHKLHCLLPPKRRNTRSIRSFQPYQRPKCRTKRYQSSFLNYSIFNFQPKLF